MTLLLSTTSSLPPTQSIQSTDSPRQRFRHAVRCAFGNTAIAAIGLTTPHVSSCLSIILFMVSTVASTPQNLQGFQLRAASLSLIGCLLGASAYALVALAAHDSYTASFFASLPFLALFSALRASTALGAAPTLANVVLGLLIISHVDKGRAAISTNLLNIVADASVAWSLACAVNLVWSDRASDVARAIVTAELRHLGTVISSVATHALHVPAVPSRSVVAPAVALSLRDLDPVSANVAPIERTPAMVRAAEDSLRFFHALPPFGRTRVIDYALLEYARVLLSTAKYEPQLPPVAASRPSGDVVAWHAVFDALASLVHRASALESVVCPPDLSFKSEDSSTPTSSSQTVSSQVHPLTDATWPSLFDRKRLHTFLGEAYIPIWVAHFATCAATCEVLAKQMSCATCDEVDHEPASGEEHPHIDPTAWRSQRAEMYFGFVLASRLEARSDDPDSELLRPAELRCLESQIARPLDLEYNVRGLPHLNRAKQEQSADRRKEVEQKIAERQAMLFFAVQTQAISEEIEHVSSAMAQMAVSKVKRNAFAPLHFAVGGLPLLWDRLRDVLQGRMHAWEIRFAIAHFLLLATVLAGALFSPVQERFRASEVAWSFTSAALAAQLSAEPTLFIGSLRVVATLTGCLLGLGASTVLLALTTERNSSSILYAQLPYVFLVTVVFVGLLPNRLRYMAFLVVVTNNIMLSCPRTAAGCHGAEAVANSNCLADWEYAVSRAANVSAGVVLALLFHVALWPRFASDEATRSLTEAVLNSVHVLRQLRLRYFTLARDRRLDDDYDNDKDNLPNGEQNGEKRKDEETPSTLQKKTSLHDVYPRSDGLARDVYARVGAHVAAAIKMVHGEASVWRNGPLRVRQVLPKLTAEALALSVSLNELGALTLRRPVFERRYGSNGDVVFRGMIRPLLRDHETLLVSVYNMAGAAVDGLCTPAGQRGDGEGSTKRRAGCGGLEDAVERLRFGVMHLARCRSELRSTARRLSGALGPTVRRVRCDVRVRLDEWANGERHRDDGAADGGGGGAGSVVNVGGCLKVVWRDDTGVVMGVTGGGARELETTVGLDEAVLYDVMTFVFDGCLSAFVRIAELVADDGDIRVRAAKCKKE